MSSFTVCRECKKSKMITEMRLGNKGKPSRICKECAAKIQRENYQGGGDFNKNLQGRIKRLERYAKQHGLKIEVLVFEE